MQTQRIRFAYRLATLALIASLVAVGCTPAATTQSGDTPGASGAVQPLPIRLGMYETRTFVTWLPDVAEELGIFKKYGLEPTTTSTTSAALNAAFLSGQIDVYCAYGFVFTTALQGQKIVTIGGLNAVTPYNLVTTQDINSMADLRGKVVSGTGQTGATYLLLKSALEQAGLTDKDYSFVAIQAVPDRIRAMVAGRAQAAVFGFDETLEAAKQGLKVLGPRIDETVRKQRPSQICVAKEEYATTHREELVRFSKSIIEASRRITNEKDTFVNTLEKFHPGKYAADVRADLYESAKRDQVWALNGGIDPEWVEEGFEIVRSERTLTPAEAAVKVSDFYTNEYAKSALDELGVIPSQTDPATWYKK